MDLLSLWKLLDATQGEKARTLIGYHLRPYHPLSHRSGDIASKIGIPNKKRILKGAK
jgi:hypothetical protein